MGSCHTQGECEGEGTVSTGRAGGWGVGHRGGFLEEVGLEPSRVVLGPRGRENWDQSRQRRLTSTATWGMTGALPALSGHPRRRGPALSPRLSADLGRRGGRDGLTEPCHCQVTRSPPRTSET